MPKKKITKPVQEMTTEELAASVFPKKVHEHLKKIVQEADAKPARRPSQKQV